MGLTSGTKLGPYEILSALGAGGMGEVYRARDTRLERTVAIKILPAHLSADPVRKQRFEREAKTISSLNHPHICVLYDVGHQEGIDYLVMECVEGETLAKRLEKGPLPLEQVLKYGAQIAEALDKAHHSGVVHRDLKPGNIMLAATGAKLLDFGLAKPVGPLASGMTLTADVPGAAMTEEGMIVGTFQYMSPEQVEGKEVDGRSDIFSLGTVLYEMVTGKRAFEGKSRLSVASAILEKEPDPITSTKPLTPPALSHVIRKCLEKFPDERWQSASDLASELRWITEGGSQLSPPSTAPGKEFGAPWRTAALWSTLALLLAMVTGLAVWHTQPVSPRPVSRAAIILPPGQRLAGLNQAALALSPDGTQLAYVAVQGGVQQIYLRPMDSLEARPVPGTEGAVNPFFSPDSQWLGFFAGQKLKKVSIGGGAAVSLSDAAQSFGASWSSSGTIAFSPLQVSTIEQVSEAGGVTRPLTKLEKGEISHRRPEFMPGGKVLLFTSGPNTFNWNTGQIVVQAVGTAERQTLVKGVIHPHYSAPGHLLYVQGGNLMAAPFDPKRLTITGAAVPVIEGLLHSTTSGTAQYTISDTGTLAYISGAAYSDQRKLVWVNRRGEEQVLSAPARSYVFPRLSPNGKQVAVSITEQESQVWLYDLSRETLSRFTFEGTLNLNPVWTPDGKRIAFQSNEGGPPNIYWQNADGSGGLERLTNSEFVHFPLSMSPDGQLLAYGEINPTTGYDLWVQQLKDRHPQPFLRTPFTESVPQFSPDAHWMAYISNESGRYEVYVQPYPGPGGKWQISTNGGTEPVWNPNGRELFYRDGGKMMSVGISTQTGFATGKPRMLFEGPYQPTPATTPNYDVSRDGQRFLMLKSSEMGEVAPTQINIVFNWSEELKRRVPTSQK
jgi:Tol biopolymer transport system component